MAASIKLWCDILNRRLVKANNSITPFVLPAFSQGDVIPLRVYILEHDAENGTNAFTYPDISSMTMKLAVYDDLIATTPLVTQFSWSKQTTTTPHYFHASVDFNTAAVGTWLDAATTKDAYLELEITESSNIVKIYKSAVTIKAEMISTGSQSVAAGLTPLSREEAISLFAQKYMPAGETITFRTADGTAFRTIGVRKDGTSIIAIEDVDDV